MIRSEDGLAEARDVLMPLRAALAAVSAGETDAIRTVERALGDLEDRWAGQADRRLQQSTRIQWLEAELRSNQAADGVLSGLERVFAAAGNALMQERHARIDNMRSRVWLDGRSLAIVIDSLATMREQVREQSADGTSPETDRVLAVFNRATDPATTVVEVQISG